jgi:hypothetical protein
MSRGYRPLLAALVVAATMFSQGCSSVNGRKNYGDIYTAPIPEGYTRKDDLLNHVRPEFRQKAKDVYDGVKLDTSYLIPESDTKITPNKVKINVPWEKLENIFSQKD